MLSCANVFVVGDRREKNVFPELVEELKSLSKQEINMVFPKKSKQSLYFFLLINIHSF